MAVGNSTDSVSAKLPGTSALAKIGWSASVTVVVAEIACPDRPSMAARTAAPASWRAFGQKYESMKRLMGVLTLSVGLGERGLQEHLGAARTGYARAQAVDGRRGRRDPGGGIGRAAGGRGRRLHTLSAGGGAQGVAQPVDHIADRDVPGGTREVCARCYGGERGVVEQCARHTLCIAGEHRGRVVEGGDTGRVRG